MFRHYKAVVFFLLVVLINVHFLVIPTAALAEDVQGGISVSRQVKASNPNCQLSQALATAVGIALAASIVLFFAAYALNFIPVIGQGLATLSIVAGIASFAGVVLGTPMYFACYWSFVKHPVLRFDINDGSGNTAGAYKTCKNPQPNYPSCANKEYRNEDEYFKCISNGVAGCKDGDIECGRKNEPMCPDKEFVSDSGYHWPKNRVSSSDYIEFCYRLPLGTGLIPLALLVYIIDTEANGGPDYYFWGETGMGPDAGYFREADYGSMDIKRGKAYIRGPVMCSKAMRANDKQNIHSITFKAVERSDKLCIDAWGAFGGVPWFPQPEIGCHMRPAGPPAPMCAESKPIIEDGKIISFDNTKCFNCYISSACYGETSLAIKSPFPVTSVIVQCIRESFDNLLSGKTCSGKDGFLLIAQKRLAKAVNAALVLALILFAIKAALGGVQNSAEVYILGLKFAFILYLTTGDAMTQYYRYLTDISVGLSDLVLEVGGNQTICDYKQEEYSKDGKSMGYLAPWDRLDCRMMFYFGSQLNGSTAGTLLATVLAAAFIFAMVFFGLQVMICLMALLMVIMIILIIVWMMYLFILSFIAITILCLLSPLFLPMMLFQATKGYFDGWVRELITYTLYPVILFAFLSLIFSVFDSLYFGDLEFERKTIKILDVERTTFVVTPEDACKLPENQTNLACMMTNATYADKPGFFGLRFSTMEFGQDSAEIWTKLGMMALMGFLFYHFLHIIGSLAAELAGNPRADLSQGTTSPHAMLGKVVTGASKTRNFLDDAVKHGKDKMMGGGDGGTKNRDELGAAGAAGGASTSGGDGSGSGGEK